MCEQYFVSSSGIMKNAFLAKKHALWAAFIYTCIYVLFFFSLTFINIIFFFFFGSSLKKGEDAIFNGAKKKKKSVQNCLYRKLKEADLLASHNRIQTRLLVFSTLTVASPALITKA